MKYDPNRKYKKGDLVRITGYRGRLFGCGNKREINDEYKLGVEVVLQEDEDYSGDVVIPEGQRLLHWLLSVSGREIKRIEYSDFCRSKSQDG